MKALQAEIAKVSQLKLPLPTRITKVQLVTYPSLSVLATWSLDASW